MAVILRFRRPPVGRTTPAQPAAVAVRLPSRCGPAQPAIPAASPPPTRPATARPQLTARTRDRPTSTLEPQANPAAEAQAGVPAQPGPRSHRAPRGRSTWPSASAWKDRSSAARTAGAWTGTAPPGSSAEWPAGAGSPSWSGRTLCGTRSSPPPSTPGFRCAMSKKRLACRPAHNDALRPGPRLSRPPRHLHRRRLPRRSRLVADLTGHKQTPPGQTAAARWSPGSRGNRIPARNRP